MFDLKVIQRMNKDAEKGILPSWYATKECCDHEYLYGEDEVACTKCGKVWISRFNSNEKGEVKP
jgi:hypothetical protein